MPEEKDSPLSWKERQKQIKRSWTVPFQRIECLCEWVSYRMGRWAFINVLDYGGKLAVVVTAITYLFHGAERKQAVEDARKAKHYQAWQAINLANGLRGNCGRFEALVDLNKDGVSLIGVNLAGAVLMGINLTNVDLYHADISDTLISQANLAGANLALAKGQRAELAASNLRNVDFTLADMADASFISADLAGVDFSGAILVNTDFRDVKNWDKIKDIDGAELSGATNLPSGFLAWATNKGAVYSINAPRPSTPPVTPSISTQPPTATPPAHPATPAEIARRRMKKRFLEENPSRAFTNDVKNLK